GIFAGGLRSLNEYTYWPYSQDNFGGLTDNTWPYSWVEVLGSTANTSGFIIQPDAVSNTTCDGNDVVALSHANLTLRGVTVRYGGWGIHAENESLVNLEGV